MSDKKDGTLLAKQLVTFVQTQGLLLGMLARSKKKRERLKAIAGLQRRISANALGPGSGALVQWLEMMLSVPVETVDLEIQLEADLRDALQGTAPAHSPPASVSENDDVSALLQRLAAQVEKPAPTPKRARRKKRSDK